MLDLPDLVVDSCSWSPLSPIPGNTVKVTFRARNAGGVESAACKYTVLLDNVEKAVGDLPRITAGGTYTVSNISMGQPKAGPHQIKVVLDTNGTVMERNDGNNTMTKTFSVVKPTGASDWEGYR